MIFFRQINFTIFLCHFRLGPEQIISLGKIEPLLGIFQKLIASKANDHEGFNLLQTMIEFMPKTVMANYNQGMIKSWDKIILIFTFF